MTRRTSLAAGLPAIPPAHAGEWWPGWFTVPCRAWWGPQWRASIDLELERLAAERAARAELQRARLAERRRRRASDGATD